MSKPPTTAELMTPDNNQADGHLSTQANFQAGKNCRVTSLPSNKARCLSLLALSTSLSASMPVQAQSLFEGMGREIVETIVYSLIGIVMAVIGFKVVDWLTPGNLAEDVAQKENRALAILAGSMIIGVCLIIASALID